jgi:hypothetical protein
MLGPQPDYLLRLSRRTTVVFATQHFGRFSNRPLGPSAFSPSTTSVARGRTVPFNKAAPGNRAVESSVCIFQRLNSLKTACLRADVRKGSKADMMGRICDVRFTHKSGHQAFMSTSPSTKRGDERSVNDRRWHCRAASTRR